MPTPMSSAPLSTPKLDVPATQNTAPVIKFRCLYTHDMRRKAKRWQDGYLRYHTFNKRIMAYDTTGNFIGDLHWRHDEEIQDGDELELDRGVLIQVCESMEKTETDLSALYNNKKSQGSPSRSGDQPVSSFRPSTPVRSAIGSQPPRSLNDLLGIKKTPIAPTPSPYDARHALQQRRSHRQPIERPGKRQKISSENISPGHSTSRPNGPQPVTIDLSDAPEPAASNRPPEPLARSENPNLVTGLSSSGSAAGIPPRTRVEPKTVETPQNTHRNATPPAPKPPSNPPDMPTNTLRLSTERPRKKLMYSALVPGTASANQSTSSSLSKPSDHKQSVQEVDLTVSGPVSNADFLPSASTQVALDEVAHRIPFYQDRTKRMTPQRTGNNLIRSSSSGLRKSYSDPTALTTNHGIGQVARSSNVPPKQDEDERPRPQGPWTSEALDLFDFWPPGRPKPS
ncbi:hypothetical protein BDV25DRAFT_148287 [Aspergillus avenaceus]|uniref:5'-3' DNA helicase ZGRF1-like N-terminal domain-containing protein n=1 Tax=Aspergillus avenaceus TaxID=36643 RepID=A0A5N6U6A1_ASPAV|nr:hypothetical protein BDV25DRAFT_148287 [Aspergillus avenaceus]